jgi:1,4-dihydroxy-2-naphthoyl-CoA hydrolase
MTKPIWFKALPTELPSMGVVGLVAHLGIELTEAGPDWVKGRMPVDERTRQPFGLLHGGASVVLAETLASIASAATLDLRQKLCVGLEINANHLRGVREGWVTGIARPVHLGRTTHVWDIRITDEAERPVCISRCTVAIIDNPGRDAQPKGETA